jgi:hypothetical protein
MTEIRYKGYLVKLDTQRLRSGEYVPVVSVEWQDEDTRSLQPIWNRRRFQALSEAIAFGTLLGQAWVDRRESRASVAHDAAAGAPGEDSRRGAPAPDSESPGVR